MTLAPYTSIGEDKAFRLGSGHYSYGKPPILLVLGIIVVGLVGAFLAGLVIDLLLPNTTLGFFATIIAAFLGAVVLLAIVHFIAGFVGRSRTSS
jgi:hypothetical protein